jgi:hypothetical protein
MALTTLPGMDATAPPDVPWAAANCRRRKQGSDGEHRFHLIFPFEIASMREVGSHLLEPGWAGFVYAKSAGSPSFT